jgi:hypothetical protein
MVGYDDFFNAEAQRTQRNLFAECFKQSPTRRCSVTANTGICTVFWGYFCVFVKN